MDKYIGEYRVIVERDTITNEQLESTYIKCRKGGQIYRYNEDVLIYYVPRKLISEVIHSKLDELHIEIIDYYNTSQETLIKFHKKDLDKVANIFEASVQGKDIKPGNKRKSIDRNRVVTEESRQRMLDRLSGKKKILN